MDHVRESKLVGLSDDFTSLATLSAINVGLTSLEGLPSLPSVAKVTGVMWVGKQYNNDVLVTLNVFMSLANRVTTGDCT